jgi:hypothetical protein
MILMFLSLYDVKAAIQRMQQRPLQDDQAHKVRLMIMQVFSLNQVPATIAAQSPSRTSACLRSRRRMVGRGGLEPPTSRLSGVRSNHLSYRPGLRATRSHRQRVGLVEPRRIELLTS